MNIKTTGWHSDAQALAVAREAMDLMRAEIKRLRDALAPTGDQIAQALCLAGCAKGGFLGCTWNGKDACIDADAAHFHEDAEKFLKKWEASDAI